MKFPALAFALIAGALLLSSCEVSFSTANIQGARLTVDEEGSAPTTTFAQNDTFYLLVQLANAPDTTVTSARWVAVDVQAEGVPKDHPLQTFDLESGSGMLKFNMANDQLWPLGSYRVDILLNGEVDRSIDFEVAAPGE